MKSNLRSTYKSLKGLVLINESVKGNNILKLKHLVLQIMTHELNIKINFYGVTMLYFWKFGALRERTYTRAQSYAILNGMLNYKVSNKLNSISLQLVLLMH